MLRSIRLERRGSRIRDLADWKSVAPPKGKDAQWEDGRSAKELARAWTRRAGNPAPPQELTSLLHGHRLFNHVTIVSGTPEDRVHFDDLPGEPRNADLNLLCESPQGTVVISVEAKADESFGGTVAQAIAAANKRAANGFRSNGRARATALVTRLLPDSTAAPDQLPYQLLTATAGLLSFAARHEAVAALLLIHEFVNGRRRSGLLATSSGKVEANAKRLNSYVTAVSGGSVTAIEPGAIVGPFALRFAPTPLFVGKLRTDLGGV